MKIILLAGGSGKRLWPLSNEIRSKIFLTLLRTEDGGRESMIQRICRQLDAAGLLSSTYIVTHQSQIEIMKNQIGEYIPIISEPYKKGTFTAISLAITYLHSKVHIDPNEMVCVIPVDLLTETAFFDLLQKLPHILAQSQADLALLGTIPKSPSNQFGYIVPKRTDSTDYYPIAHFVEKPDEQKARTLLKHNALWNCGVFAFPLKFMLSHLTEKKLPLVYEEMLAQYKQLPELGFDYEVVEKIPHSIVVPYDGPWNDLGSWEALVCHLKSNILGSGQITDDSVNTHIVNELSYPITVIDVSNIIVAASLDGILIASKKNANRIKQILPPPQRPLYEEKRWGTYHVLDHSKAENEIETLTKKIKLLPGKNISYQLHHKREEVWIIISGSGEFILENKLYPIKTGDVLQIPLGAKHGLKATTPLELIEVQIGTELVEEDIVRLAMSWEEAVKYCNNEDNHV